MPAMVCKNFFRVGLQQKYFRILPAGELRVLSPFFLHLCELDRFVILTKLRFENWSKSTAAEM